MSAQAHLALYERIALATRRMADSARRGEWEALVNAERECGDLVRQARALAPVALDGPARARKAALLRAMLADDADVRACVSPEMARLEALIGTARRAARANLAYVREQPGGAR